MTALELSTEVAAAESCDRNGKHAEAVNLLVAGARKGDVEATTRLGKRLLVGDRAPLLPNDGAGLLEDAARLGGAEAPALLAVLFALGVSRAHDLRAALESLALAAERGWSAAQQQLQALACVANDDPRAPHVDAGRGVWRSAAQRVDLGAWQSAPAGTSLSDSPRVRSFPSLLAEPVCRWLIDKARGRLSRALVYEALIKRTTVHHTRTNSAAMFNILDTDLVCVLTQHRMAASLGVPLRHFEPMTVLHYDEGERITEHFDFVDPNVPGYDQEIQRGQRIATFLVYLNEDYEAGETEFVRLGISHKGRGGEGLYFVNALADGSADVRTLHAGRPPTAGEKWIVSQFVRNRPAF
jgi:hypothetical protein